MIQKELLNNGTLVRQYSNAGFMILQNETCTIYSEAIDFIPCGFTYSETNIPVIQNEDEIII